MTTVASRHTRSGSQERQRRQTLEYRTTSSSARADGSKSRAFLAGIYTVVNGSVQRGSKRIMQPEVTDDARREKDDARSEVRVARLAAETEQS